MKKERYFRHELERMFIAYAIVPAVIFTLVCGMLFYDRAAPREKERQY